MSEAKGVCCCNRKVMLEPFPGLQPLLMELLSGVGPLCKRALLTIIGSTMVALQ